MSREISFNVPVYLPKGVEYIREAIQINRRMNGDGPFTRKCSAWFEDKLKTKALLTTSCTHALEMAAILLDVQPGDEVIMPSFTFVSTANAFVTRGAKIKFVDIRKDTMNIDENLIEQAVTEKTKVIVPVHYAGVGCDMDKIMNIAQKYNIAVVEDAAQGMMSSYKGKSLGTIGDFGTFSFHETKNYTMGEGGICLINNPEYVERAEIIREKGTNRAKFFRGQVDKYSWVDMGSSYLPSEINAAYLLAQLEIADEINNNRLETWNRYYNGLKKLALENIIDLPIIPSECKHNAHMFYIKVKDLKMRQEIIRYLKENGIGAVFHYVPLHTSNAGKKYGEFIGEDNYTTSESNKLIRLPMYYDISDADIDFVIKKIYDYFQL